MTRSSTGTDQVPKRPEAPLGHVIALGRWSGVCIYAHWSVLFTLALFADLLATSALPAARPHESNLAYWLAGIITALAFLVTLIAHELAHAVVARHFGMRVKKITLWLLGGMTELDGDPQTPRADGLVALAGPTTSLAIGVGTAASAWSVGFNGLAGASLSWLASMSVLLGVFNLLPGTPLDGGRVLRALLWWRTHDRGRAVAGAARSGRVLGSLLALVGFLLVLDGSLGGLWLGLIGWFMIAGAAGEQMASRTGRLRGLHAGEVMSPAPVVAPQWWTVQQFLSQLAPGQSRQPAYPVVDFGGATVGVLTLADLQRVPADALDATVLRSLLGRRGTAPLVLPPDADLADVAAAIGAHRGLAIIEDGGHPVGLISAFELTQAARLAELGWHQPS